MQIDKFWKSMKGLLYRLADVSHNFTWGTLNTTTKEIIVLYEKRPERRLIRWATKGDIKVCPICYKNGRENDGEYNVDDPLLPFMPAHVNCRCWWEMKV